MKLKNKYSKQNIHSNQKFEDQIWYNQQMEWTFKPRLFARKKFFLENKFRKNKFQESELFSNIW